MIYDDLFEAYERATALLSIKKERLATAKGWRAKKRLRRQIRVLQNGVDEMAIDLTVARMRHG